MPEHYSSFGEAAGAAMANNARTAARHTVERAAEEQTAEAPRNALDAPQTAEPPAPGPEQHPGGENGPHTGTQDRAAGPPSTLPCACCCTDPNHVGRPDHCDPELHRAFREAITRQWPGVAEYVMDDVLHAVVDCHLELVGRAAGAPHPADEERWQRYAAAITAGGSCVDFAAATRAVLAVADAEQAERRAALAPQAGDDAGEQLVQIGWYCWRCHGLVTQACRSDNVPVSAPAAWATELLAEITRREDGAEEPQR